MRYATASLKIRTDYAIECPTCGGRMKFLNPTEALVFNPSVGQLWHCEKCNTDWILTLRRYKEKP